MATHSRTLAWKIPWVEEPGRLQPMRSLRVRHNWLHFHFSLSCIREGNGKCSCLENPRDSGAWWAAIYGIAESQTCWSNLAAAAAADSILKSRDISLLTKVYLVKAMVFLEVRSDYESWTIKKAEHQRINGFKLWHLIRLLRVPWTSRRSNQSVLKEINPEYSLEGLMVKLKLQLFRPLIQRSESLDRP